MTEAVAKTPAEPTIDDVSAQYPGLKPHERVYRSVSGYFVKIATIRFRPDDLTAVHFQITGALVGKPGEADRPGQPHLVVVKPESAVDLAAVVEAERRRVVGWMELAAIHQAAAAALAGVGGADA
jgi:hypothetical protein